MSIQDARGNLHGQDGRFTQKPLPAGGDLDNQPPATTSSLPPEINDADLVAYHENGAPQKATWLDSDGKKHRDNDQPAVIEYDEDGALAVKEWRRHGKKHRDNNQPYRVDYYPNGAVAAKTWHGPRTDGGPDSITYHPNGRAYTMSWGNKAGYHREDGPAFIKYDDDGAVVNEKWGLNGRYVPPRDADTARFARDYDQQYATLDGTGTDYGTRGYTTDAARLLYQQHHQKSGMEGESLEGYWRFSEADTDTAKQLQTMLPAEALQDRQNNSPTLGCMLQACANNPDVYLDGYCITPVRSDERVTVTTLTVPDSYGYPDEVEDKWDDIKTRYGLDALDSPDSMWTTDAGDEGSVVMYWD